MTKKPLSCQLSYFLTSFHAFWPDYALKQGKLEAKTSTDGSGEDPTLPKPTLSYPIPNIDPFWPVIARLAMNCRLVGLIARQGSIAGSRLVA